MQRLVQADARSVDLEPAKLHIMSFAEFKSRSNPDFALKF